MSDRSYSIENVSQSTSSDTVSLIIVDDEGAIRRGLSSSVGWDSLGIAVAGTAADGAEALTLMESSQPDIVITDIKMPGMDGLEFIAACRERGYESRFIILSGFSDFEFAREAIRYGVRSYLLKPVRIAELRKEAFALKNEVLEDKKRKSEDAASSIRAAENRLMAREHRILALATGSAPSGMDDALEAIFPDGIPLPPYRIVLIRPECDGPGEPGNDDGFSGPAAAIREAIFRSTLGLPVFRIPGLETIGALITDCASDRDTNACLDRISAVSSLGLKFGVGLPVAEFARLGESFSSARAAMDYFMYPESGSRMFADSIPDSPPPAGRASEYGISIAEKIRLGDAAGLERELDDFIEDLFFVPMPPPEFFRGMCVYLLVDLERILLETCQVDGALFDAHPTLIIRALCTASEIQEYVAAMARSMMDQVARSRRAADPMIKRAKEYIRENALGKLRIEDLAERENLSASYFAVLFKSCVGEPFRDFLLRCRLDHAKLLMASRNSSIAEISEMLGYEDYRSFNRAFKRHTGYTPSVYRRAVSPAGRECRGDSQA